MTIHATSPLPLRSAHRGPSPRLGPADLDRAEGAVADLLDALGLDRTSDGLADTPRRVARMYADLLSPEPVAMTTFDNEGDDDQLVVVSDIPVSSLCEHHLLPFRGVAHVGYLPGQRIVGLSKLARVVQSCARRPQVQERLTTEVADWIADDVAPRGVGVTIEAEHLCMSMRGARADGARTTTSTFRGVLRDDLDIRREFFQTVAGSRSAA